MLRKAKNKKNGNHPTILSRWKAQESYRKSLAKHNIGEKESCFTTELLWRTTTTQVRKLNEYKIQSIGFSRQMLKDLNYLAWSAVTAPANSRMWSFMVPCTQNTHRSVRHEQHSLLTSTNMQCVLVAQELNGSGLQRHHCAHENCQSSGQPCHLLAGLFHTHFQSTRTRSTTWTARPSPRRHCTPSISSRSCTVDKQR